LELELLSSLGLSAMALGNHELSLSASALSEVLSESARFPVLAANLSPHTDSPLFGHLTSSVVLGAQGVRLGVIGLANPNSPPNLEQAGNPWGLAASPELAAAAQLAIDELASRAALIVVLSHLGLDQDRALVAGTSGIDLVLGGHQHIITPEPEWQDDCESRALQAARGCSPRRVPIVHSGAYSQWLSRIELDLQADAAAHESLEIADVKLTQLPSAESVQPDPAVAQFLEARRLPPEPPLAFLPDGVARRAALGGDSPLGNVTADAMRAATGADVVILNTSGLRDDLEPGVLLKSELELAFPFHEPWRLVWLSGSALREGLERAARRSAAQACTSTLQVSGLRLKMRCAACVARAASCLELTLSGALGMSPLDDTARVLTALPEYLTLAGGDFAAVADSGAALEGDVSAALAQQFQALPRGGDGAACRAALRSLSPERCHEAFAALACPPSEAQSDAVCRGLPSLKGARDARIEVLP
jgi:5'-nucleotidase